MKKLLYIISLTLFNYSVLAQDLISNLPQSAILVRLQTNEHIIKYYLNQGNIQKANKEELRQKKKNSEIINTFTDEWEFCPVYFFYSDKSQQIINKDFKNIFKNTEEDRLSFEEIQKLKNEFIIIYFGETQGKLKFNALVLNDSKMQQLKKPYPKFVRTYKGLGFLSRNTSKTIRILKQKISWHYDNK